MYAWRGRQGMYSLILSLVNLALLSQAVSRYILAWSVTSSNKFSTYPDVTCHIHMLPVLVWVVSTTLRQALMAAQ